MGKSLFFVADDGLHGRELWTCDGEGHCSLVADLYPGFPGSSPEKLFDADGWLCFTAETAEHGREPWVLDAGTGGASMLRDIAPGPASSDAQCLGTGQGVTFLTASCLESGREPWVAAPAKRSCELLMDTAAGPESGFGWNGAVSPDGFFYFYAYFRFWRSDGTLPGTNEVARVMPRGSCDIKYTEAPIAFLGTRTVFFADDPACGLELWVKEHKQVPCLLKDINPGRASSNVTSLAVFRDVMYFGADDHAHGIELWRSDGTPEGTHLVKDICPGMGSSRPYSYAVAGNRLFFLADDGEHGKELWTTDGTDDETVMVEDLYPGVAPSDPWCVTEAGERLFFCATSPEYGEEVFSVDANTLEVSLLKDIVSGPDAQGPHLLTWSGDRLYFVYDHPFYGEELWISDGTAVGTRITKDINVPRRNPSSGPRALTPLGDGKVVFAARDAAHGEELWISDASEAGTALLCDIGAGVADADAQHLTFAGKHVFFTAADQAHGRELWVTDGTGIGTRLVGDIRSGLEGSAPEGLCAVGDSVFFLADDGAHGCQLWHSNGLADGTFPLDWPAEEGGRGRVVRLCEFRGDLYVYAETPDGLTSLYCLRLSSGERRGEPGVVARPERERLLEKQDAGPNENTPMELVKLIYPVRGGRSGESPLCVEGATYFVRREDAHGSELWRAVEPAGKLQLVCDAFPGPASSSPRCLAWADGALHFIAEHPREGNTLWQSDGTPMGTAVLTVIAGSGRETSTAPIDMTALDGTIVMAALPPLDRESENCELEFIPPPNARGYRVSWRCNIRPGEAGSWPRRLTRCGRYVYFTADDGIHGEELWVTEGTVESTRLVKDILGSADLSALARPEPWGRPGEPPVDDASNP